MKVDGERISSGRKNQILLGICEFSHKLDKVETNTVNLHLPQARGNL